MFGRESLVTILEHQDEAQGNKDTTKALILKAKQMKMRYCAISVCRNNSKKQPDLSFFDFPSEKKLRKKWSTFCRRADKEFQSTANLHICSQHFNTEDIVKTLCGIKKVVNGAIPTIFNPQEVPSGTSEREKRLISRRGKRNLREESDVKFPAKSPRVSSDVALKDHDYIFPCKENKVSSSPTEKNINAVNESVSVSCQTDIDQLEMEELVKTVARLKIENKNLRNKVNNKAAMKREIFMDNVLNNDESVKFYTGLPTLTCLMAIFNILKPLAEKLKYWDSNKGNKVNFQKKPSVKKSGKKRSLTTFQEFILTLVRLRLGLLVRHLSDIFAISKSSVSKVFTTWICFLAITLKDILLIWPAKESIRKHLPQSFKNYPATRVIIDCTEIFIQKPTSPAAQRATWSEYKGHNTMKTLVGITPSGFFSFVSKLWSGSTSDRKLTQKSGILELIEEGDHVMADRGFTIRDLLTKRKAYLNMPPFSKKGKLKILKKQLPGNC